MPRELELYVAGDNFNSRRAQANLEEIVKRLDERNHSDCRRCD